MELLHFVTQLYILKEIFSVTLHAKFAIIDCDCAGKKKLLFAHLLNYRKVLRR